MILPVSPAQDSEQFRYIHLTPGEREHQETIRAHFDSAGREVITLPCPNFEEFILANFLRTCYVSFLCNLPEYILRLGHWILKDTAYSSDGHPDLLWLPRSPSATLPSLLSRGHNRSASPPANVMTRACPPQPSRTPFQPDPDRITPPTFFFMGGLVGQLSPLTSSDFHPVQKDPLSSVLIEGDPHQGVTSLLNICRRCSLSYHLALLPSSHPLPVLWYQHHWIQPSLHLPPILRNFSLPPNISQSKTSHLTWESNLLLTRTVRQMQGRSSMPAFAAPRC